MKVYVFGLGHIGLPMATWFALCGHKVIGIDINPDIIEEIKNGTVNIEEYYQEQHISQIALSQIESNSLNVSTKFTRIDNEPSIFVVAVGITDKENGDHDVTPLISVIETLSPHFVAGDLLLLRTTLIPGTIEKIIVPRLEKIRDQIHLAYCPETIMETRAFEELEKNSLILAGIDDESVKAAEAFLKSLSNAPIYRASSIRTAEMVKVIQNIHRDVNVALINEISEAAYQLGVNVYELIDLANTHPRVTLLQPGPGVGGYCLPNALGYLQEAVDIEGCSLNLMSTARKLNTERPRQIVQVIIKALYEAGKSLSQATIAVIGLAMKDFCSDCRNSPAHEVTSQLISAGARVRAYDPMVSITRDYQVSSFQECLRNADCLVILANQEGIRYEREQMEMLMAKPIIVVDTRNVIPSFPGMKVYKP